MSLKNLLLFLIVSALDAICILLGSFMGHSIRSIGLFAGAIIGGIVALPRQFGWQLASASLRVQAMPRHS